MTQNFMDIRLVPKLLFFQAFFLFVQTNLGITFYDSKFPFSMVPRTKIRITVFLELHIFSNVLTDV